MRWLEKHLREYPGAILIVTHDRYFLDNVTGWILELDRGRGIPYEGNYSAYLEKKAKRMAQEGREDAARQRALDREREWIAASPRARQAKSKARIQAYDELLKRNEERAPGTRADHHPARRAARRQRHRDRGPVEGLWRPAADRRPVLQAAARRHRRRHRPERRRQDDAVPHDHRRRRSPTPARSRSARRVHLGYVDQSRDDLAPNKTVWEEISGGNDIIKLGKREMNSRAYVGAFNFKGGDQQQKVGSLSGGQRNRVHLAKLLKAGANVLLLDEPTNDLDTETLAALEDALEDFAGCAVIISPRPHVPRPPRHPHPRLRGRQPCRVVRGQLRGLRGRQGPPPRRRRRQPAPGQVQAADAVERKARTCGATALFSQVFVAPLRLRFRQIDKR